MLKNTLLFLTIIQLSAPLAAQADPDIELRPDSVIDLADNAPSITFVLRNHRTDDICGILVREGVLPGELNRISKKLEFEVAAKIPAYYHLAKVTFPHPGVLNIDLTPYRAADTLFVRISSLDGQSLAENTGPLFPTHIPSPYITATAEKCRVEPTVR